MEGGSSNDESTTTEPRSSVARPAKPPGLGLCRVGSGGSAILDPEGGGAEAESRKLPSSRFKGVVPQPNGRWGAQIYEKHQRVWLGTFNEEQEAAVAYDVAARKFRGGDAVTNFKGTPPPADKSFEAVFLGSHSKSEIVDMLRKHTYGEELQQSRRNHGGRADSKAASMGTATCKAREQLFEKSVTPSDVGKLNRLVIPKQHAEKHFPLRAGPTCKGLLLNFEDTNGKMWRFRYSYWNSSQSYVLTKGWSRFVKEKSLRAGDIVGFHRSTGSDRQLYIDTKSRSGSGEGSAGPTLPMVRLFGVDIFKAPVGANGDGVVVGGRCNGKKRMTEMELLGLECGKKPRVIIDAL